MEKDVRRAADYYQRALAAPIQSKIGPANRLGAFYYNGDGVEQDYAKAFQLLKWAYDQDTSSNWGAYYLGACCAHGRGTQQDYVQARKFLEMVDWDNRNAFYLLGYLYARGLGGPEDIPKGVEYLQKAGRPCRGQGGAAALQKDLLRQVGAAVSSSRQTEPHRSEKQNHSTALMGRTRVFAAGENLGAGAALPSRALKSRREERAFGPRSPQKRTRLTSCPFLWKGWLKSIF